MNQNPTASDWASDRGEKWLRQMDQMEAMLKAVDEPLIQALKLDAPYRIADIGCGGGATTIELLRRAPTGSTACGFDVSPALIDAARARSKGDTRVTFELADVATFPVPSQPFDRLTSRFGIMFFQDHDLAFRNLANWLTPGGRFAFAAWGPPPENPWMSVVRKIVSESIDFPRADPDAPGPFRYGEADKLLTILKASGFDQLEVRDWRGKIPVGGGLPPPRAAEFSLDSFSALSEAMATASEEARTTVTKTLTARFAEHEQNGIVRMDACVHIFTGSR